MRGPCGQHDGQSLPPSSAYRSSRHAQRAPHQCREQLRRSPLISGVVPAKSCAVLQYAATESCLRECWSHSIRTGSAFSLPDLLHAWCGRIPESCPVPSVEDAPASAVSCPSGLRKSAVERFLPASVQNQSQPARGSSDNPVQLLSPAIPASQNSKVSDAAWAAPPQCV